MPEFLTPIAAAIGISPADTIVAAFVLVFLIICLFLWSSKLYGAILSWAIGLGIYLVLWVLLLSPEANPSGLLFSPTLSKFLVESSAYLPIILAFMGFAGGDFWIRGSSNKALRFLEPVFLGTLFLAFLFAMIIGLVQKTYVFTADTFFSLAKKSDFINLFLSTSKALVWITSEIRMVVILTMLFSIYKWLFADIVESMISAAIKSLLKARKWGWNSTPAHEEIHEEEEAWGEEFEEHDEHGHGHH